MRMSTFFYGRGRFQRPALPNGFSGRAAMSPRPFMRASQATPSSYGRGRFRRPALPNGFSGRAGMSPRPFYAGIASDALGLRATVVFASRSAVEGVSRLRYF